MFIRARRARHSGGFGTYYSVVATKRNGGKVRHIQVAALGEFTTVESALWHARRALCMLESIREYRYGTPRRARRHWGPVAEQQLNARIQQAAERVDLLEIVAKAMRCSAKQVKTERNFFGTTGDPNAAH
jgi:hypothetical protein